MAAQNNAIRTIYMKVLTDYTQQNIKYAFCLNKDKTVNPK